MGKFFVVVLLVGAFGAGYYLRKNETVCASRSTIIGCVCVQTPQMLRVCAADAVETMSKRSQAPDSTDALKDMAGSLRRWRV